MKRGKTWNARQLTVTAVFVLSLIYGADELLSGGESSESIAEGARTAATTVQKIVQTVAPENPAPGPESGHPAGPSQTAMAEANRWRPRDWETKDPFEGESWLASRNLTQEWKALSNADTVLRATSRSPDGWRAVAGMSVLEVGDEYFGGRVVRISEGTVVIRGAGWERVLRFPEKQGK